MDYTAECSSPQQSKKQTPNYSFTRYHGLDVVIGESEAKLLIWLHYWQCRANTIKFGMVWQYRNYEHVRINVFPHRSLRTVQRSFARLIELGLIIKSNDPANHRFLVRLQYEEIAKLESQAYKIISDEGGTWHHTFWPQWYELAYLQNLEAENGKVMPVCHEVPGNVTGGDGQIGISNSYSPSPQTFAASEIPTIPRPVQQDATNLREQYDNTLACARVLADFLAREGWDKRFLQKYILEPTHRLLIIHHQAGKPIRYLEKIVDSIIELFSDPEYALEDKWQASMKNGEPHEDFINSILDKDDSVYTAYSNAISEIEENRKPGCLPGVNAIIACMYKQYYEWWRDRADEEVEVQSTGFS